MIEVPAAPEQGWSSYGEDTELGEGGGFPTGRSGHSPCPSAHPFLSSPSQHPSRLLRPRTAFSSRVIAPVGEGLSWDRVSVHL